MKTRIQRNKHWSLNSIAAAAIIASSASGYAGSFTWDFTADPKTGTNPIEVFQSGFLDSTGNSVYWKAAGGNPGGFLGVTWPIRGSSSIMLFPDIDQGKTVTAFRLEADLRVGSPQQNERAADGFSISFARSSDPVFENHSAGDLASGLAEAGTTTGLAIGFDTWSGNALPDGADIEGIIVRVDNKTVLRQAMPTRNGACTDPTSLQTGPRNTQYWTDVKADPNNPFDQASNPDAAYVADSWTNLCWQHLTVEVDTNAQVTVIWKGTTILDRFKTDFFPSPGGLVLAGRTGDADEHTHFDNITLTTSAVDVDTTPPTAPSNLAAATPVGATRVALSWNAAVDNSGPVAYEVERDGVVIAPTVTSTNYVDLGAAPSKATTYRVRAKDVSGNFSPFATVQATTAAQVTVPGTVQVQIYDGISGTGVDLLVADPDFPNSPNRVTYAPGLIVGSINGLAGWNESLGDNYGARITGVLTPTVSGQYDFFIRSDDASQFFLNQNGAALPDLAAGALVTEDTCCHAFLEPDDVNNTGMTTTSPVNLTAGNSYGFVALVKEGGGGDGVAVGMRRVGDTTPAANVPPISGLLVSGTGDPVGATLEILTQPANVSVMANERAGFSVTATNFNFFNTPTWYQWLRNGVPIPGAVSSTYTNPAVPIADNNAQISVAVGGAGIVRTSQVAVVTVTPDTKKPTIARVSQRDDTFTNVTINFSEPVTTPSATTVGNYTLSGGATVSSATLSPDGFSVNLTTSKLNESTEYTLTANNLADIGGNTIEANTQVKFDSWARLLSTVNIGIFNDISGTAVNLLTADPRYPNTPDDSFASTNGLLIGLPNGNAGWNGSYGDNFGMRITGTLSPPVTGQYHFFIRSDDASQFFLNTTGAALPATTGTPTVREDGCCNAFQEPGTALQTTATPISLTAGTQYGFVVLLKEGGGGDGVAVGMRLVGDTTPAGSLPAITEFGPKPIVAPAQVTVSIAVNAQGQLVISWNGAGRLQSTPSLTAPTWTDVAGAVSGQPINAPADDTFYRVAVQ